MKHPTFFISGGPRCGTTALYTYLSEHPKIFMSEVKELNYFASDFPNVQKIAFKSVDDYHKVFAKAGPEHIAVGEASPFYLFSRRAFENMHNYDPGAKVIITLRNPVEFIESYHRLNLSLLREDEPILGKAWDLQSARKNGQHIPKSARQVELLMYAELGQFSRYVERLFSIFPREQVKIFLFDDLRTNPQAVYEQTLAFIGVPSDGRQEFPQINANFENKSALLARLFHPPQPVYQAFVKFIALFGTGFMEKVSILYNRLERLNTTRATRNSLDPALRARMLEHFTPDIIRLSGMIDRDLSGWLKNP
ncbi:MAG: sulfotransferase [Chloroflexota bacterium]